MDKHPLHLIPTNKIYFKQKIYLWQSRIVVKFYPILMCVKRYADGNM